MRRTLSNGARRRVPLAALAVISLALALATGCGRGGDAGAAPAPSRARLWSYEELLARTSERIAAETWPDGLRPSAAEVIGPRDAGPPAYDPGFDASRVAYDRLCVWWVAWHDAAERDPVTPAALLDGLDDAVEDFAASDNPGAPVGQLTLALDQARRGDTAGLRGPAFTRSCLLGAGRWWDRRRAAA